MIVAIHQPEHLPWRGFLRKMQVADVFVVLDDVQFTKNNRQNRNQIVSLSGEMQWITVPVVGKGRLSANIASTRISYSTPWQRSYLNRLHSAYSRYPHFPELYNDIEHVILCASESLFDLNISLLHLLCDRFHITTQIVYSSRLAISDVKSERLVSILNALRADTYLAGEGGAGYMDLNIFAAAGIKVKFNVFDPPTYEALNGYNPGVSAVDALFALGPRAANWI